MHVCVGVGVGVGSDLVGAEVGVGCDCGGVAAGGVVAGAGSASAEEDSASLSGLSFFALPFEDFDGEGEAPGDGESVALPALAPPSPGLDFPPTSDAAAPSADSSPAEAGLEVEKGASTPSSARLSPPAASTQAAVISRTRRRRLR